MQQSLTELLDEQACYEWLLEILHPKGLYCPNGHALPVGQAPHDRQRTPIVKYKGNVGKCSIFLQGQTYQEAITPVVRSC
jgi:hypothetical protein